MGRRVLDAIVLASLLSPLALADPSASDGFLLFAGEETREARIGTPSGCGSAVRSYAAGTALPAREAKVPASWSATGKGCVTTFEATWTGPLIHPSNLTVQIRITCGPTALDPGSFRVQVEVAGRRSPQTPSSGNATGCGERPMNVLTFDVPNPSTSWRPRDPVTVLVWHDVLAHSAQPLEIRFAVGPTAPPLLTVKPGPGTNGEAPAPEQAPDAPPSQFSLAAIERNPAPDKRPALDASVPLEAGAVALTQGASGLAAFAWLGRPRLRLAAALLFARLRPSRLAEQPRRAAILAAVSSHAGIGLAELARTLEFSRGSVRHHLALLGAAGLTLLVRVGGREHVFLTGQATAKRRAAMILANKAWGQRIITAVRARPGLRQRELARAVGMTASSILWATRRLEEAGLVRARRMAGDVRYFAD